METPNCVLSEDISTMLFEDWFPTSKGFVGIRREFNGTAVYEYRSETELKRHWYQQRMVAVALFEELRMYLEA